MEFTELLQEAPNFGQQELSAIKSYTGDNGGRFYQIPGKPKVKLSFADGANNKITISKGVKMYTVTLGNTRRAFKDFNSLVKYLEDET